MLIKGVVSKTRGSRRRGDPILFTPHECLPKAIEYATSKKDGSEFIYWVRKGSLEETSNSFKATEVDKEGNWVASSRGTVLLGKTHIAKDRFYEPKKYKYSIEYRSAKDHLGLPDIEVTSFDASPVVAKTSTGASTQNAVSTSTSSDVDSPGSEGSEDNF